MANTKGLLERAGRLAPPATFTLLDVEMTRGRREALRRVTTVLVALSLTALAFVSVASALLRSDDGIVRPAGSNDALPSATEPPLVAGPGQFYSRAVLFVLDGCAGAAAECDPGGSRLDATFVWSPHDDSGRIVVDEAHGYGIEAGRFDPGDFPNPNGIDVSSFPMDAETLTRFLLDRSAEGGASPAPIVTPPPEGAATDGQLWRAITDLLQDPHVTPAVRAVLLNVAAGLQGSRVETDVVDPFGRPAHVIEFGNWGGEMPERLYVDPATHELLTWTMSSTAGELLGIFVVQDVGVVDSVDTAPAPAERSVPLTLLSTGDLQALIPRAG
jgi:hypothetical protein